MFCALCACADRICVGVADHVSSAAAHTLVGGEDVHAKIQSRRTRVLSPGVVRVVRLRSKQKTKERVKPSTDWRVRLRKVPKVPLS